MLSSACFVKLVRLRNSIFWPILTCGTCSSTLTGTELNEESDEMIRFYVCSIITSQSVVKVSRSKFAFFFIFKTVEKRVFSHFSPFLAVFSGFVIEF